MPKFKAPENPKEVWTTEMITEKIGMVENDIKDLCRNLNKTQTDLNKIFTKRFEIQQRIGNKNRYKKQLLEQLKEKQNSEWEEV